MRGITQKSASARDVKLTDRLPLKLEPVPRDVVERFPSMAGFGSGMESWYEELKRTLLLDLRAIEDALANHQGSITEILADLASLQAAITALQEQLANQDDCTDVEQDLAALLAQFQQHITATIAHESNGDVAGLNDIDTSTGVTMEELMFHV